MLYRRLGHTGLVVSRLAFGAMTFTAGNARHGRVATTDAGEAQALVDRAIGAGINFFDTADVYSDGESERILGLALRGRRDDAVIATKVGNRLGDALTRAGLSRRHIAMSIDESLERLGTDRVDIYIAHREDPYTPLEETLEALDAVVRSGKAHYIGCSNWSAWRIAAALEIQKANGWAQFSHAQLYYSLVGRDIEQEYVAMARRYGLGITVWSPLTGGFLTGKYSREANPAGGGRGETLGFYPFDRARGEAVVDLLREIAGTLGATPAQVALAWLLAQPHVTSIIVGASRTAQLDDNLGAATLALDAATLERLDEATAIAPLYPNWFPYQDPLRDALGEA